jgi:hypothetical protein
MQAGGPVEPGHRLGIGISRNARSKVAQIGTQRRKGIDLHREDAALTIESHPGNTVVIARLRIRKEDF